jgi:phospholipid-transporting ATPase
MQGKMLAIGDGANDVAMIQAADVGIGIAGKEGRQAVNNSDYAIPQFRFLTRLLLVHGQLSQYRLGRLIKYSFYKNSCFAGVLFYFQIYNGFSGQTLIDDISAAVYNVIFTSLPILFFSLLDQPYGFDTMQTYPRTYNKSRGLSVPIFWKTGVVHVRKLPSNTYCSKDAPLVCALRTNKIACIWRWIVPSYLHSCCALAVQHMV